MYLSKANDSKSGIKKHTTFLFILTILVCAVYFSSLNNAFVSDDISSIRDNSNINKINFFWSGSFFYLGAFFTFLINKFFGLNPLFYRLLNIIFHLGCVWLVYSLLNLFYHRPLPFFAAAIFAVHPVLGEAVVWISGAPYVQYSFFLLLSFIFYVLSDKNRGFYIISLLFFISSLSCSEKATVFPILLIFWEISSKGFLRNWRKTLPFFILSGFWIFLHLSRIGERSAILISQYYQEKGINNPLLQIPIAVTSYLQLIFWPDKLTLYHSEMSFTWTEYLIRLAIFILFLGIIFYSYKRNPVIFFGLSFFIISLLPTLTPFRISWIVAERYAYLGTLGIIIASTAALQRLWETKIPKPFFYILFSLIIVALSARTIIRSIDWKNEDNLWLATAKTSPSSHNNHNNLGDLYSRRGDWETAVKEFKIAIKIKPNYADAYHNLANAYLNMGKIDEAIESYGKAVYFNPNLWQSYQNLAAIYFQLERYDLAKENLLQALKIIPDNPIPHLNLGIIYLRQGQKLKAKDEFKKADKLDPNNSKIKELIGSVS